MQLELSSCSIEQAEAENKTLSYNGNADWPYI